MDIIVEHVVSGLVCIGLPLPPLHKTIPRYPCARTEYVRGFAASRLPEVHGENAAAASPTRLARSNRCGCGLLNPYARQKFRSCGNGRRGQSLPGYTRVRIG